MKTIKPFFTREQLDEIIYQYTKLNKSAFSLEKMFNCCAGTIIKNLKLEGIKLRTQKESTTKYSLNENFFNEIDTEEKAYFLGLMYADGCIKTKQWEINISLQEEDKYIIERFCKALETDRPLYFCPPNKKFPHRKNQYRLIIKNKVMFNNLISLGVTPRKSLTLKFPTEEQVPKNLLSHFIRGYFDGDGCVMLTKPQYKTNFRSKTFGFVGTLDFLTNLHKILLNINIGSIGKNICKVKDKEIYRLKYGGNQIAKIFQDYIYKDSDPTLCLTRKRDKFS